MKPFADSLSAKTKVKFEGQVSSAEYCKFCYLDKNRALYILEKLTYTKLEGALLNGNFLLITLDGLIKIFAYGKYMQWPKRKKIFLERYKYLNVT